MSDIKNIMNIIKENDVAFVDLRFTDPRGKWQHLSMCAEMMDEDAFTDGGQRCAEVDRRSRLADAALLVGHGEDAGITREMEFDVLEVAPSCTQISDLSRQGCVDPESLVRRSLLGLFHVKHPLLSMAAFHSNRYRGPCLHSPASRGSLSELTYLD